MARQLTEKQQKFLQVLFDQAQGDLVQAKKLAGYSANTPTTEVVNSMKDEIVAATTDYIARNAPSAAVAMVSAIHDPTQLGIKDRMNAAKELLDRTGIVKTEKMSVEASGGVMILPPKKADDDDQ